MAQLVKNQPAMWETWVQSLSWEDPLAYGLESRLVLTLHSTQKHGEGNDIPLQYSCLENPMDGGAW